jgi:hypothetical protein
MELTHQLNELRAELAEIRSQHMQPRGAGRLRSGNMLLAAPLIVVGSWVLSAQVSGGTSPDVEKRLSTLESLIRRGPGNTTQLTAPLNVIGADGKVVLQVTAGEPSAGAVAIWRAPGRPGGNVTIRSDNGTTLGALGTASAGHGVAFTSDAQGHPRTQLNGTGGVVLLDEKTNQIAGMVTSQGRGRVGVWNSGGTRVASLDVDADHGNSGAVTIMAPTGKAVATMGVAKEGDAGALRVLNSAGTAVAGLIGGHNGGGAVVVANSAGVGLAQMSVSDDGRGLLQVFRGGSPIAVLTEAKEYPGGLLQISDSKTGPVASVSAGGHGGFFQLTNVSGVATVEAGTLESGRGMVRVGPQYKCNPIKASTPVIGVPGFEDCLVGSTGSK